MRDAARVRGMHGLGLVRPVGVSIRMRAVCARRDPNHGSTEFPSEFSEKQLTARWARLACKKQELTKR